MLKEEVGGELSVILFVQEVTKWMEVKEEEKEYQDSGGAWLNILSLFLRRLYLLCLCWYALILCNTRDGRIVRLYSWIVKELNYKLGGVII